MRFSLPRQYPSEKYLICFILFFAFLVRFNGLSHGLPYLYNFDEACFVNPAIYTLFTGDFNPHWHGHPGTFVIYLLVILFTIILRICFFYYFLSGQVSHTAEFVHLFCTDSMLHRTLLYFSGRLLMVVFAVVTVYWVYRIGRKIFNPAVGLLAAFCLSASPLHIYHSRLIRTDIAATMLIVGSFYYLLLYIEQKSHSFFLVKSALLAGFSIAAKYPSGMVVLPIVVAGGFLDRRKRNLFSLKYLLDCIGLKTNLGRAMALVFLGFFVFAPYVILDFKQALPDIMREAQQEHLGHERLPGWQQHIWYIKGVLVEGIGNMFFALFAVYGLILTVWNKSFKKYLFLIFPVSYYIFIVGFGPLRWSRWLIPVLPFEAILFGAGFRGFYEYLVRYSRLQGYKTKVMMVLTAIFVFCALSVTIKDIQRGIFLDRPDTRILAKVWVEKNLPPGSVIAYEHYAPLLHVDPANKFMLINVNWERIVSRPLFFYREKGVDYIIITDFFKKRYFAEPQKYQKEIERYRELAREAELIKVFTNQHNPGPEIEIYRVNADRGITEGGQ